MKILSLVATAIGMFLSAGCTIPADAGCVSDQECYAGRVCDNGACTGEVSLASNNISSNNTSMNNTSMNNGGNNTMNNGGNNTMNNGGNNTINNGNNGNNANNVTTVRCDSSDECDDDLVCAWDEVGDQTCVEPWACDAHVEVEFDFCFFEIACDVGPYFLECDFGDEDNGVCFCHSPEGFSAEFEANRDICDDPTDLVNQNCGWSIPRF